MKTSYNTYYFSDGLRWSILTFSVVFIGYMLIKSFIGYWLILVPFFSATIFTLEYSFQVDSDHNIITDKLKVLGLTLRNKKVMYKNLICIRLDKEKQHYTANTRSRERQVSYNEYTATLITDKGEFEILRRSDYQSFKNKLNSFSTSINIEIRRTF